VEHRIEFVATVNGISFFNDSKATNVDSSIKAVESFDGNIIIILGGKDKGSPYEPLLDAMKSRVKHVILIGAAADRIAEAIGSRFPVSRATSLMDAARQGRDIGKPGDIVLLSPSCASFDMFDNYEHRGKVFKEVVQSWQKK
jgi:UDP-N-acetylmuramoylalanine--D-glutamate ligase